MMEEAPFPHLPFPLVSKIGAAAWQAGHEAVRSGALVLRQSQYIIAEPSVKAYAAEQARRHMQETVQRLGLTPALGVRVFAIYWKIYLEGVLDEGAQQAGQVGE